MFTGLIETQGIVTHVERADGGARIQVYAPEFGRDMALGDSVAVDGACLTVSQFQRGAFVADVSEETISKTTLGGLRQGEQGQPRARAASVRPARRPHGDGTRRGCRQAAHAAPVGQLDDLPVPGPAGADGLHRGQGVDRRRRHLADGRPDPGRELRRGGGARTPKRSPRSRTSRSAHRSTSKSTSWPSTSGTSSTSTPAA